MIRLNVGTSDKSTHSKGSWDENSPTEIKRGDSTSSLGLSNHGSKHGSAHGNHLSTPRALYRALSSRYHKSQTDLTALTEIGIREITPSITVKSTQILDITKFPIVASNYSSELKLDHFTNIAHLCYGSHSEIATCHYDNKSVIVKVISQEHHDSSIAMQEFQREVNILSRLNHPHIVGIIGTGIVTKPGLSIQSPLIALEYLEGNTLKHHLSIRRPFHSRPFTELRYLRMAREFADALVYLHQGFSSECTLIHRDLKPDNLGFTPAGLLKILDFGLCIPLKKDTSDSGTYTLTGENISYYYIFQS
jgi:serine/threonine protein kinase